MKRALRLAGQGAAAITLCLLGGAPLAGQRILGGTPSSEHPAVGALLDAGGNLVCSGFLVGPSCVLTSAHCVDSGQLTGGRFLLGPDIDLPYQFLINVRAVQDHPSWDPNTLAHDIAVVALESAANIPALPLGSPGVVGSAIRLVGFGLAEGSNIGERRKVDTVIAALSSQQIQWSGTSSNVCDGDSGGPTLRLVSGTWQAVGVASFADGSCNQFGGSWRTDADLNSFVLPAVALCTATQVGNGLFLDGFESETTERWSAAVPTLLHCAAGAANGGDGDGAAASASSICPAE